MYKMICFHRNPLVVSLPNSLGFYRLCRSAAKLTQNINASVKLHISMLHQLTMKTHAFPGLRISASIT